MARAKAKAATATVALGEKIKTEYTINGQELFYAIYEDGYEFFIGENEIPWVAQRAPYDKVIAGATYEERVQNHLKEFHKDQDPDPEPQPQPEMQARLEELESMMAMLTAGINETL